MVIIMEVKILEEKLFRFVMLWLEKKGMQKLFTRFEGEIINVLFYFLWRCVLG